MNFDRSKVSSATEVLKRTGPNHRHLRATVFSRLIAFDAVAHQRSFSKAATKLGMSVASLSQSIRSLEDQLATRLFNRTTRTVALTEAGEYLMRRLQPILEGVDETMDDVITLGNAPTGLLRIAVHPVAAHSCIPSIAKRFAMCYPAIELAVCVDSSLKNVVTDNCDAAILFDESPLPHMIARPLGKIRGIQTVASPAYLRNYPTLGCPLDLQRHNCIRYEWGSNGSHAIWKYIRSDEVQSIRADGSLSLNDLNLALQAAIDGVGIAQLPEELSKQAVARGELVTLLGGWEPLIGCFTLIYPQGKHMPRKLRALIDIIKIEFKARRQDASFCDTAAL